MYCSNCEAEIEEAGGSQMRECHHFLCFGCIEKLVSTSTEKRLFCVASVGLFKCTGYLRRREISWMVPDDVFQLYLRRIKHSHKFGKVRTQKNPTKFENLNLPEDEKDNGIAHKLDLIDDLVRHYGLSYTEAEEQWDSMPIMENRATINCGICFDDITPGNGVVLKDCFHLFCKNCIAQHIRTSDIALVECPHPDCDEPLKFSEVCALSTEEEVERHFNKLSLKEAEASMQNVQHCLNPNCPGFVIVDGGVSEFNCPVCNVNNCLPCKATHPGSCKQFQQQLEDDKNRLLQRENDRLSADVIQQNLNRRVFMNCPRCNVVIEKNGGCPNMRCTNRGCQHSFQWIGV